MLTPTYEDEVTSSFDFYVKMIQRYAYPIMVVIGLFGNTLSFIILSMPSNRKNIMGFYLRVLAVCDTFALNFFLVPRWVFNVWPVYLKNASLGSFACILHYYVSFTFCPTSNSLILLIALDRFLVVRFPLKAPQWCTMKKAKILVAIDLIVHILIYIPNVLRTASKDENGYYVICGMPPGASWYIFGFKIVNALDVAIPMGSLFFINVAIILTLRKHSAGLKDSTGGKGSKRSKQERSLTVMLLIVALSLMLFILPYTLDFIAWDIFLTGRLAREPSLKHLRSFTYEIGFALSQLNNSLNFFMYLASSQKFRKDIHRLFSGKLGSFMSLTTSSTTGPKSTNVHSTQ
ncbi:FMRFamide peptide receptor frpr-18-like [Lineus longissimus]|uniref:FMRFamide peptide receptor frpr-18-like n=1 Tax=Lineus longissimus TaxID=88925 RepID=UPI002B4F1D48